MTNPLTPLSNAKLYNLQSESENAVTITPTELTSTQVTAQRILVQQPVAAAHTQAPHSYTLTNPSTTSVSAHAVTAGAQRLEQPIRKISDDKFSPECVLDFLRTSTEEQLNKLQDHNLDYAENLQFVRESTDDAFAGIWASSIDWLMALKMTPKEIPRENGFTLEGPGKKKELSRLGFKATYDIAPSMKVTFNPSAFDKDGKPLKLLIGVEGISATVKYPLMTAIKIKFPEIEYDLRTHVLTITRGIIPGESWVTETAKTAVIGWIDSLKEAHKNDLLPYKKPLVDLIGPIKANATSLTATFNLAEFPIRFYQEWVTQFLPKR